MSSIQKRLAEAGMPPLTPEEAQEALAAQGIKVKKPDRLAPTTITVLKERWDAAQRALTLTEKLREEHSIGDYEEFEQIVDRMELAEDRQEEWEQAFDGDECEEVYARMEDLKVERQEMEDEIGKLKQKLRFLRHTEEENDKLKELTQEEINEAVKSDEGTIKLYGDIAKLIDVVKQKEEEIKELKNSLEVVKNSEDGDKVIAEQENKQLKQTIFECGDTLQKRLGITLYNRDTKDVAHEFDVRMSECLDEIDERAQDKNTILYREEEELTIAHADIVSLQEEGKKLRSDIGDLRGEECLARDGARVLMCNLQQLLWDDDEQVGSPSLRLGWGLSDKIISFLNELAEDPYENLCCSVDKDGLYGKVEREGKNVITDYTLLTLDKGVECLCCSGAFAFKDVNTNHEHSVSLCGECLDKFH